MHAQPLTKERLPLAVSFHDRDGEPNIRGLGQGRLARGRDQATAKLQSLGQPRGPIADPLFFERDDVGLSAVVNHATVEQVFLAGVREHERPRRLRWTEGDGSQFGDVGLAGGPGGIAGDQPAKSSGRGLAHIARFAGDLDQFASFAEGKHATLADGLGAGRPHAIAAGERLLDVLLSRMAPIGGSPAIETRLRGTVRVRHAMSDRQ